MATALIGLGSNLGDREGWLRLALDRLDAHPLVDVTATSGLYETAAVGGPSGQGPFLNACATLEVGLDPEALLRLMLDIERIAGRVRTVKNAPRTLDLDVLLFDDMERDDPGLTIPHPAMLERPFVMVPAAEVAGHHIHPVAGDVLSKLAPPVASSVGVAFHRGDWWPTTDTDTESSP